MVLSAVCQKVSRNLASGRLAPLSPTQPFATDKMALESRRRAWFSAQHIPPI
jgi:hypothetical protein